MKNILVYCLLSAVLVCRAQQPLRVGIAGLSHDHVHNAMNQYRRGEVIIVGIAEPDKRIAARFIKSYNLPDSLFFKDLPALLRHTKPDAVLAYNSIADHLGVIETCAPQGVSVMVEKPLATTVKDAERIASLAARYNIHVLTNYETTWYNSNQHVNTLVQSGNIGEVRKMIVHDGHNGPKEIGCSADFLSWLTDPIQNGGGAIRDFGCYGANLMTWIMKGQMPIAVTAITRQIKPSVYPEVDDDATILLEYPRATGIIEASWNWPFNIKDLEVFGTGGYLHALDNSNLHQRKKDITEKVEVKPAIYQDNLSYLVDVLRGKVQPGDDLSSLSNNLIVVRILEAASRSAKEGKRIVF